MTPRGHSVLLVTTAIILHLSHTSASLACNRTYTSPHGVITTPNFPLAYPGGITCSWRITFNNVTDVTGITLLFAKFLTQEMNSANLYEEELLIYDRNPSLNNSWPQVYQGKLSNSSVYHTQSNEVWLRFTSATDVLNTTGTPGIKILYAAKMQREKCDNLAVPPNTILIGENFTVGSFAEFYCNSGFRMEGDSVLMCVLDTTLPRWTATPPSCLDTCTVPTIKNGEARYVSLRINTTTQFSCTPPYVISGRQRVTCISDINGLPTWRTEFPRCVIPDCSETVDLRENEGAIVNPGYSTNTIQANEGCHWTITVQSGSVVRLHMRYFDLPSDKGSFLEVADVADGRTVRLRLVGGQRARNVTSSSHKVDITYRGPSTSSSSNAGFYIQYDMDSGSMLGQGHGTTPYVRPATTKAPTTSINVITTYVSNDGADTIKISVGVAVPTVILLGILVGCYCWYRKKYPVRMIIGREFAKFSNPDYASKGNSTLTLVREDAEDFFKQASRATSTVSLVVDDTGPHYVNVGFTGNANGVVSGELAPEEHQPIDEDEEEREMMKRKSYLFSHRDDYEAKRNSESGTDTESVGGSSLGSKNAKDVVVTVEQEEDQLETSPQQDSNQSFLSESTIDEFNAQNPKRAIRKTSVGVLLERTKERRAFTNEERPTRRFSFDASLSVRGRSLSAKTPEEVSRDAMKLNVLLARCDFSKSQVSSEQEVIKEEDSTQEEMPVNTNRHNYENISESSSDGHRTKTISGSDGEGVSENNNDSHTDEENNQSDKEHSDAQDEPQAEEADEEQSDSQPQGQAEEADEGPPGGSGYDEVDGNVIPPDDVMRSDGLKEIKDEPSDSGKYSGKDSELDSLSSNEDVDDVSIEEKDEMNVPNPRTAGKDGDSHSDEGTKDEEDFKQVSENEKSDEKTFHGDYSDQEGIKDECDKDDSVVPVQSIQDNQNPQMLKSDQKTDFTQGEQNMDMCHDDKHLELTKGDEIIDLAQADQSIKVSPGDENSELSVRHKSESLSESITSDSAVSSNSNASGSYNFGNDSDDAGDDEDDEGDDEDDNCDDDDDKTIGDDDTHYKSAVDDDNQNQNDSHDPNVQISERVSDDHQVPDSEHQKPEVNPDSSSISSFDQSLLDTSAELSSVSTESPILTQRSLPALPNPSGQKKVAAPVFSMGDDEDISSTDSDEEATPKKSESMLPVVTMPGIEEEDSDESGKGQAKSYSFGEGGSENGREFTDDDLMAELSDDSDDNKDTTHAQRQSLAPGMLYFDEVEDDDVDV